MEEHNIIKPPYRVKKKFDETQIWRSIVTAYNIYVLHNMSIRADLRNTIGNKIINYFSEAAELSRSMYMSKSYTKKIELAINTKNIILNLNININLLYEARQINLKILENLESIIKDIITQLITWINTNKKYITQQTDKNNKNNELSNIVEVGTTYQEQNKNIVDELPF